MSKATTVTEESVKQAVLKVINDQIKEATSGAKSPYADQIAALGKLRDAEEKGPAQDAIMEAIDRLTDAEAAKHKPFHDIVRRGVELAFSEKYPQPKGGKPSASVGKARTPKEGGNKRRSPEALQALKDAALEVMKHAPKEGISKGDFLAKLGDHDHQDNTPKDILGDDLVKSNGARGNAALYTYHGK